MRDCLLAVAVLAFAGTAGPAFGACSGRIVTLGGDVTAIVYALGAGQCVVATDTTSAWPPAAKELPRVGYLRNLNAEGIIALRPDMVIGSADAGPPQVLDQLRAAGVRVELVPDRDTAAGVVKKIRAVARALGRPEAGAALIADIKTRLCRLRHRLAAVDSPKRVLFFLTMASGSPQAAGTDTAAAHIIELAGGINAVSRFSGYKPLTAEALVKLAPDVILLMSEGDVGGSAVLALPGVSLTPAGRHRNIITMDGTFLLSFGPRVARAATALAEKLYPQLPAAAAVTRDGACRP